MAHISSREQIRSLGTKSVELPEKTSESSTKMKHESLLASQRKIWKSPLSWKITLVVFATILTIQIFMFALTIQQREAEILHNIQNTAQAAVLQSIRLDGASADAFTSPITDAEWQQLSQTTPIIGISIYSQDLYLLAQYGDPSLIQLMEASDVTQTYWSADGSF